MLQEAVPDGYVDLLYTDGAVWTAKKLTMGPAANLPYLEHPDLSANEYPLTESKAILHYLARRYDFCGKDLAEGAQIDNILYMAEDLRAAYASLMYNAQDFATEKIAFDTILVCHLEKLSSIAGGRDFLVGSKVSAADFFLYELLFCLSHLSPTLIPPSLGTWMDGLPNLVPSIRIVQERTKCLNFNGSAAWWDCKFDDGEYQPIVKSK